MVTSDTTRPCNHFIPAIPYNKKRPPRPTIRDEAAVSVVPPTFARLLAAGTASYSHDRLRSSHAPLSEGYRATTHRRACARLSIAGSGVNFSRLRARRGSQSLAPTPCLSLAAYSLRHRLLRVFGCLVRLSAARRWRAASKSITLAATAAFSDSTLFHIGMLTAVRSQCRLRRCAVRLIADHHRRTLRQVDRIIRACAPASARIWRTDGAPCNRRLISSQFSPVRTGR